jgi:hypothetical protein
MTSTQLGVIKTQTPEGTTSITAEGLRHTVTRTMPLADAYDVNTHTDASRPINVMDSFVFLQSINITREPGEVAMVTYEYFAPRVYPVGGITGPGSIVGPSGGQQEQLNRISYSCVLEPVSLLRHRRYQNLAQEDLRVLAAMIQNGPIDSDGNETRRFLSGDTVAEECANKIEQGKTSYLAPSIVARATYFGGRWNDRRGVSHLGKTDGPPTELPGSSGFDFILASVDADGTNEGVDSYTTVWQSAPNGEEWDRDLYF